MSAHRYVLGVAFFMAGAAIALVTYRVLEGGSIGIITGLYGGSGIISFIGLGLMIQAIIPEE